MVRILVIEDDPNILKLLPSDLELEGYTVFTAKDGMEGLDRARTLKPDLIILDIMLPKMNGYDVCRTLRKDGSEIPIMMLTAKGQEAGHQPPLMGEGLSTSASVFVVPSLSMMTLVTVL